jgi:hypothetical protein
MMETTNLPSGSWALVQFEGFKAHFCPSELVADLIADIEVRGGPATEVTLAVKGGADLPGIVLANRSWEDIPIGGFKLGFPSQDFEHFMAELERSPVRRFASGREYHKIHGWLHCVVLTPEQRADVLRTMGEMLPEVRERADEENRLFLKAMERVNEGKLRAVSWREAALRGEAMRVTVPPKGEKN